LLGVDYCVVGMTGYPNVGKSSTINVLVGRKSVAVSATPGKTKHFQVLLPALIFYSKFIFLSIKFDSLTSGVLELMLLK
jgi:GTPase SAR1 family protein